MKLQAAHAGSNSPATCCAPTFKPEADAIRDVETAAKNDNISVRLMANGEIYAGKSRPKSRTIGVVKLTGSMLLLSKTGLIKMG